MLLSSGQQTAEPMVCNVYDIVKEFGVKFIPSVLESRDIIVLRGLSIGQFRRYDFHGSFGLFQVALWVQCLERLTRLDRLTQ